jgi:hypothetical protein
VPGNVFGFTHFMWRPPQAIAEIDTMQPALVY